MKKIINFLFGLIIIFCIQYLSIFVLKNLNIPFPASILGIIILFLLLKFNLIKEELIKDFCNFILKYMILFFIPMFVGIITYKNILLNNFGAIILTVFVSTTIVIVSVGLFIEYAIKFKRLHSLKRVKK